MTKQTKLKKELRFAVNEILAAVDLLDDVSIDVTVKSRNFKIKIDIIDLMNTGKKIAKMLPMSI